MRMYVIMIASFIVLMIGMFTNVEYDVKLFLCVMGSLGIVAGAGIGINDEAKLRREDRRSERGEK